MLFLDELHTVVGAGAGVEGTMDAADILKPALARGELQVVGATTLEEYRRHVESDQALERRFAPITVDEPTIEQTVAILDGLKGRYEDHHGVRLPEDTRRAAVELTARHVRDRFLPDKAIDALDTAAARVRLRRAEDPGASGTVSVTDIAQVVADRTGLPVAHLTDSERTRLLGLADHLRRRVVGQDHALDAVTDAVLAGRAGMGAPGRPVASFLFAGPTGVGKTELARALAEALHGSDERLVRLDLGEFREAHTVARLTGAPPGYIGHDRPGELTEAIRRTPSCVVLLDEIEKAHPDVLALLLGVLDAGRLTDGRGRTVSFADAVVILTSNLGASALTEGRDPDEARSAVLSALARALRPEFLGRVDEVVLFAPLDPEARAPGGGAPARRHARAPGGPGGVAGGDARRRRRPRRARPRSGAGGPPDAPRRHPRGRPRAVQAHRRRCAAPGRQGDHRRARRRGAADDRGHGLRVRGR